MFVVVSHSEGNQKGKESISTVKKIPDLLDAQGASWEHQAHGFGLEEMKSKENEKALTESAGTLGGHTSTKSLAAIKSLTCEVACEGNPKGEPHYLSPYLIPESATAGKQIFTTDTYQEPDCLRFCQSVSSDSIEISLSGFTVRALAAGQVARTNKPFSEGVHYWEIICPISLSTLQIGISNKSQKEEVTQQFRTTTPRVVGIELNLDKLTLNFWLNGRFIKERQKKIPPNHIWYPTVKFKEADYFVVINPFAQGRGFIQEETNSNYLPANLRTQEASLFTRNAAFAMKGFLLCHGLNIEYSTSKSNEDIEQEIRKLVKLNQPPQNEGEVNQLEMVQGLQEVKIFYKLKKPEEETVTVSFALLQFQNERESIKFYHRNKDLKLLHPKQIAQLILQGNNASGSSPTKKIDKSGDLPTAISKDVAAVILETIFPQDNSFAFLSGLTADLTTEKLAKKIILLKESFEEGTNIPAHGTRSHDKDQEQTSIHYIQESDKLLLTNGSELKLVTRENGQFPVDKSLSFTLYPSSPNSRVRLDITPEQFAFLVKHLDWTMLSSQMLDIMGEFFDSCQTSKNQTSVVVPYNIAFMAIKSLLNIGITQYELLEQSYDSLQEQEILHKYTPSTGAQAKHALKEKFLASLPPRNDMTLPFEFGTISVIDAHQLLNILLSLEDQLWAMIQTDQVPTSVKDLWDQRSSARVHTAYGRLSSLITFPQSILNPKDNSADILTLADMGLLNTNDKYGRLQHFQEFRTELENIFQSSGSGNIQELQIALEKQFPHNLMIKGFPSWNVPLAHTINKLPPQVHENGEPLGENRNHELITTVKEASGSNVVMTAGQDGSVNIWSTAVKLHRLGIYNFKAALLQDDGINESMLKELLMNEEESKEADSEGGVRLILSSCLKNSQTHKKMTKVDSALVQGGAATSDVVQHEDILFTMFEEQPEAFGSGDDGKNHGSNGLLNELSDKDSQKDASEDLAAYLVDFLDQPMVTKTVNKAPSSQVVKEEVKEEVKEQPPLKKAASALEKEVAPLEKPIEPNKEFLQTLTLMGFTLDLCKKGLIKVKNESVDAAVEAIMEIQESELAEEAKKKATKPTSGTKLQIVSWACPICTYVNPDGKSICEVCGEQAPQTSYVLVKSEEELKREQEEAERQQREIEEAAAKQEKERREKEAEELRKIEEEKIKKEQEEIEARFKEELQSKVKAYFESTKVVDHLFAQVRGGSDARPIIAGTVLKNPLKATHDVHIARFSYKSSYLRQFVNFNGGTKRYCQICDLPFNNSDLCNEHVLHAHLDLVQSLYPSFIGSQQLTKTANDIKLNRNSYHPLYAETVASIVLPFEQLELFCQIGSNLTHTDPIYLICIGRQEGELNRSVIIQKIECTSQDTSDLRFTTVQDSHFLDVIGLPVSNIDAMFYDNQSKQLVIQMNNQVAVTLPLKESEDGMFILNKRYSWTLKPDERILDVKHGIAFIIEKPTNRVHRILIDEKKITERAIQEESARAPTLESLHISNTGVPELQRNESSAGLSENDILAMQIESKNVTANDIRRYEKLMSGKAIRARSNAHTLQALDKSENAMSRNLFTKNHWIINKDNYNSPIELEFERPTSLIALNIELTFNCKDSNKLIEQLQQTSQQSTNYPESILKAKEIGMNMMEKKESTQAKIGQDTFNLGLLSIHDTHPTHQASVLQQSHQETKTQQYLPLIVNHHKGAAYNQTFQVCRVIMDNDKIFASNYPLPEFYFKHASGQRMQIDKFTVRSNPNSKCGAFPIGSGLIFTAEHLSAFEKTVPFHRFTLQDYLDWRQERMKDPTPLRPFEPVAYFEFGNETQITFEPDSQRLCKYIFLKPTAFRKKPTLYSQKFHLAPLEIEFFGVIGSSKEDAEINSVASLTDQESSIHEMSTAISSLYNLKLNVLNENKVLKSLNGIEIQQIIGFDQSLNQRTLATNNKSLEKSNILTGRTVLKITDSRLQLREVKGLSLSFNLPSNLLSETEDIWELRGVSVQGIVAGQEVGPSTPLFKKPEIPLSYMRSCLLSPKFYNVVNKVLARMASSANESPSLRMTLIQFLSRIMKLDRDFVPLVQSDIQLREFLRINLFQGDASGIQLVIEFLQNFQRDPTFCTDLYQILLDYLDKIPEKFMSYHGYEALIGMLKWAIPLDPQLTLRHLLRALYEQITLMKVPQLQTEECIQFRTKRQPTTCFPFDQLPSFKQKASSIRSATKIDSASSTDTSTKQLLPVTQMQRQRFPSSHVWEVELATPALVANDIRLWLGLPSGAEAYQYKLAVKIIDAETQHLLFFHTYEEQIYAQFAAVSKPQQQPSEPLYINGLALKGKFKVIIDFGASYSSIPRTAQRASSIDSLLEVYGGPTDHSLKSLLDRKAQDFWQSQAKLYSVGRSVQMLQIVQDPSSSLFVPQGTQSSPSPVNEKETFQAISTDTLSTSIQQQQHQANVMQELVQLQEELKGKLRANDPNIQEIVSKISTLQQSISEPPSSSADTGLINTVSVIPSLEYYLTIVSDIMKLVRTLFKNSQKSITPNSISKVFREITQDGDLCQMAFEIFKRYVVYDQGAQVKQDALSFITESLYPVMIKEEARGLVFKIIEEFLSQPQSLFSQMAVLDALSTLGIPEGELIAFMIHKLGISQGKELISPKDKQYEPAVQPFVFMSSILILALGALKQISVPEPGQALHKGVSCSICHTKHIVGWRYKCGHCPGDVNFDDKCVSKHLSEYPNHVMIIIQEPLPYKRPAAAAGKSYQKQQKESEQNYNQPLLPPFEFNDQQNQQDMTASMQHIDVSCECCGKKPVQGNLFKCVNCEDYNLCEQCYSQNQYEHFNYHIFMQLHKPLKQVDKSPTTLLQVLDHRLYPQSSQSQVTAIGEQVSPAKKKPSMMAVAAAEENGDEEDDFDDLEPLSMSRSSSMPMSQKLKKKQPSQVAASAVSKQQQQGINDSTSTFQHKEYEKLDCDQQFVVLFHTCVWVTQDHQPKRFSKEEKIVLLKLLIETMLSLIKLTAVKHLLDVVSNREAFFQLMVSILQLNSRGLITLFKSLFDLIRQPPSYLRKVKEDKLLEEKKLKNEAKAAERKQLMLEEHRTMKKLLETLISHIQTFLKQLIDLGLEPDMAKLTIATGIIDAQLLLNSYANQRVWLEHLALVLELFLKANEDLKTISGLLQEEQPKSNVPASSADDNDDEDLLPLAVARSVSLPTAAKSSSQAATANKSSSNSALSLIKSLVQLLYINDIAGTNIAQTTVINPLQGPHSQPTNKAASTSQAKKSISHFRETESQTKYLSQMWSLVLKSLTAVSVNQLIEARIFDALVNAFLLSTEEIKQITYPQILQITEIIATQSVHTSDISKFICNLLFITLENVTDNHHEKVGYSICQGWLDILISGSTARPQAQYEAVKKVHAKMSGEELSVYLKKTSQYLLNYLNKGSFEGVTGANMITMMRLNLASDLLYVIRHSEHKTRPGVLAIQDLFIQVSKSPRIRRDFQEAISSLLAWLILNARQAKDDQVTSQLGNSSPLTPATAKVKQITEHIEELFALLGDTDNTLASASLNSESNNAAMNYECSTEAAVKVALQGLTSIVKRMNKTLLDLANGGQLGFDTSIRLSERTNEYFTKLLGQWLISDSVASFFVFDLGGFEFLLDTIGVGAAPTEPLRSSNIEQESSKRDRRQMMTMNVPDQPKPSTFEADQEESILSSLAGSDLSSFLASRVLEVAQASEGTVTQSSTSKIDKPSESPTQLLQFDKANPVYVQEFSKNMVMVANNGGDVAATYSKTDWSVNKRAYKHRIIIKHLLGNLRPEYWILFQLPQPVELREVQIAFTNYWAADTEVYAEPLSVLVEAGMDENNLSLVCNLQVIKDDAFGSVSATVFGQNLQTFPTASGQIESAASSSASIEELIQQKLQSLQNFKVQFIKFRMRRHVLTCLENSPLATKFTKQAAFAINYISLLGFDLSKTGGDYASFIRQEQKKTALEVLSLICSGDFASILKVIANQPATINKIKLSFNLLASLICIKANLIEPTFIAISTYNTEMGDWIINQFLESMPKACPSASASNASYRHASLVGEIVICNKQEMSRRLALLKDFVMKQLRQVTHEERSQHGILIKKILPFVKVFVQTLRIAAPDLEAAGETMVELGNKESHLLDIITLLSGATQERELQTKILTQLLVLLLCPPAPFINSSIDTFGFAVKHLIEDSTSMDESSHQREHIASILTAARTQIAQEILDKSIKLDKLLNHGRGQAIEDSEKSQNTQLQHAIKFWINVSQDPNVRKQLATNKVPIKLYEILRSENPEKSQKIIRRDSVINEQELDLMIELIKQLTAGNESLEIEMSAMLMKDLEHMGHIRDMNFVNKVFLQLLRIEKSVPICLWPFDSENKKWLTTFKPEILADQVSSQTTSHNNFVQSTLLQGEKRSALIKNFKEILGQHSKVQAKKLLGSNWTLSHSQTEQGQVGQFQGFWKNIENKAPIIALIGGTTSTGSNIVFGCYCSKGVPPVPANLSQDQEYPVTSSPEDFIFCYIDDNSFHHFAVKQGLPIVSMFTDYEGGGAISVANDFMLMSYSYDFVFTVGTLYDIEKIQEQNNPKPVKEVEGSGIVFQRFEVWSPSLGVAKEAALKEAGATAASAAGPQPSKIVTGASQAHHFDTSMSLSEIKHPWFNSLSPFIHYRTNPVFMVPAHLNLKQLSQILLESTVSFKTRLVGGQVQTPSFEENVESLFSQLTKDHSRYELVNGILDLEYDINQLLGSIQQSTEEAKEIQQIEEAATSDLGQVISGYVPRMGLFEQFEKQGGVKSIIQVTLASLKLWKADEQAKSWELWLRELESFSEIPLFFQLFLKNTRCKDLLFKVLAGLPDSEITLEGSKTEAASKWEEEQKAAVQFNYKILSEAFSISNDLKLRETAMKCGLLPRILDRLAQISGEKARTFDEEASVEEDSSAVKDGQMMQQQNVSKEEKNVDKKKRKGVGYSSKVGQTFNVAQYLENKKQRNEQIKNLVDICSNFVASKEWQATEEVMNIILESALLPLLESAFRNGSWLDMAKENEVYHSFLALARAFAQQKNLIACLVKIDPRYKPTQTEPIYKLLQKLNDLAEIFINCLNQQTKAEQDSEIPENLARDVIKTHKIVSQAVQKLLKNQKDENFIENALHKPIQQAYKALLQDLRFDYMDMKDPNDTSGAHFKHHYQSVAAQNQNPPPSKMVRLAQELADLSNALPYEHTNAIFVRVDSTRVDLMKALICGASNTPYAHGCYEYDIFCDNNYPREPPKMNLITTGGGAVRFNPNLYACGKVCLSLLGTWRGSATENWDPKLSTILQVLLSTQAIIMSEEVYFNEPGFENEAGTPEGEKKNEGYQNIVRYCNIKFAMIAQLKRPSKGFESAIKRHFYIKKPEILKEVHQWLELADKNEAAYSGLVNDHNYNWANQFKATKTKYKEMLTAVVQELEDELNKLERPTDYELQLQQEQKKRQQQQAVKAKGAKKQAITEGKAELGDIDVASDEETKEEETTLIDTTAKKSLEEEGGIDIEDEAVKDRWSRYIGAMGVEAVAKQASANIFLSGAGVLGIEIAKNLVLAGCKSFTLHDDKPISYRDLSGQFFLNLEEDILGGSGEKKKHLPATRGEACIHRLKQLNHYVKVRLAPSQALPQDEATLTQEPWNFVLYDVIILTETTSHQEIAKIDVYCRKHGKKLIVAEAYGVFSRVFTDFGDNFEVLDKNGEELQDVMIRAIEADADEALVELIAGQKHKLEDGDEVLITQVQGMKLKPDQQHSENNKDIKSDSINDTIHKVKVVSPHAFKIGSTKPYEKYEINGIARQLKTKKVMKFKSYQEAVIEAKVDSLPLDANLAVADFEKIQNGHLSHLVFDALDVFRAKNSGALPQSWNRKDCLKFLEIAKELAVSQKYSSSIKPPAEWDDDGKGNATLELKFLSLFAMTAQGVFGPLCAFQGGVVAQEAVKAITQKYTPIEQLFYWDALEILPPQFDPRVHLNETQTTDEQFDKFVSETIQAKEAKHRSDGLRIVLGGEMLEKLAHTRLFMVGAGAIGCELLKNYAMLGVGTGKAQPSKKLQAGSIVLTDPDVIEVSNLNRQFLFREKHLRKPKSSTAAAAAVYMNRELKDNIIARLDKVHEGSAHIFTDQFFEDLTVVTNALDNVHARRYIDARCVVARTPLLESGTLGPKGHVQVVLPHLTESYGSMNDPEDNTEIPHCTLKMFPEETLHCVEWARDKFGKLFTQGPQNAIKLLDEGKSFQPASQEDAKSLKEVVKLLEKRPKSFADCLKYARLKFEKLFNHDIRQLLHVYPLDSKTKEGAPFWSLPKRPPTPVDFDPNNTLHAQFIAAMACLRANIFKLEIPSKAPRSEEFRKYCGQEAAQVSVPKFVPNDEKAKEIASSVNKEAAKDDEEEKLPVNQETMINTSSGHDMNDVDSLMKRFSALLNELEPKLEENKEGGEPDSSKIISPEQFEKDNDQNFHIDVIYAMANCRSNNYKLDPMDWITVKLKAGRIVPALATTTAAVAGLQTIELVKLIRGCKKTDFRNVFLNLAVPIMQASEPGDVMKTKLTENIEVSLWDRWEVNKGKGNKDVTLAEVIKQVEEGHPGLEIRDVMRGNAPLYFYAIMNAPGKEADKEKTLSSSVADLANIDPSEDKYVDLNISCVRTGDQEGKILSGVPPVRVYFE